MDELKVICHLYLTKREGETDEEALGRLRNLLDSELRNLADHQVSYQIHKIVTD